MMVQGISPVLIWAINVAYGIFWQNQIYWKKIVRGGQGIEAASGPILYQRKILQVHI